jgi:DNA-binding MarR family transcriptional regulator
VTAELLFNEARLLFHTLKRWVEAIHPESEVTTSMRAVLELLLVDGPATVPAMARARSVSRQHIQQQVDALLDQGLIERRENPAHRRSPLIVLSDRGRALIQTLRSEELHALSRLQSGVSDSAITEAAQVLAAWRTVLARDADRRTT